MTKRQRELSESLDRANDLWELHRLLPDKEWIYREWTRAEARLDNLLTKGGTK